MTTVGRALLTAVVALAAAGGTAQAATQQIPGVGPNMTIYVGDTGSLQAVLPNQTEGMFFGSDNDAASNGFYLRIKSGAQAGTTYSSQSGMTPVSNGPVTGNFTPSSPAQNVTVYTAGPAGGPALLSVRQTTLYVGFQKRFRVVYEVTNVSGAPLQYIAGTAADLFIAGDDRGRGIFIDGPQRFVGGTNTASLKTGGLQEATSSQLPGETNPTAVPRWASYGEGFYSTILSRLTSFDAFDNQISDALIDNGVGASWDDRATTGLPARQTARYEVSWHADRPVPLTASPAQASRELPGTHTVVLTVIDANFKSVPGVPIRYRVNGVDATPAQPTQYFRAVTNDAGQVIMKIVGTTPGQDTVLAFADVVGPENGIRDPAEPEASARVTWLADNRIDGPPQVPASLTGPNGSVPVQVQANPDNAEAPTFIFGKSATSRAGFPDCTYDGRPGRRLNFPVSVTLQPGAGTIGSAQLLVVDRAQHDPNATNGPTAPPVLASSSQAGNRYTFTVECVTVSDLWVRFTITEGTTTQTFVIPIGGLLLVDPQGVVYDRAAYDAAIAAGRTPDQARADAAIAGATVRLQRRNSQGTFVDLISGDPAIQPNVNPETTGADGVFQWDVADGTYRVQVTAPGFVDADSRVVDVPPPVLDLHVAMVRVPAIPGPVPPPGAVAPPGGVRPPANLVANFLKALLPSSRSRVKVSRNGALTLGSLSCAAGVKICASATVTVRPVGRGKGKRRLPAVLAVRTLQLKPGQATKVVLTLSKRTRGLVRAKRSVPVVVTVTGAGAKALTARVVLVRG